MGDVDLVWYLKQVSKEKTFKIINEKHRVPILKDVYEITRELKPLRHVLNTSLDWRALEDASAKHELTKEIISEYLDANPTHPRGITKLYAALKEKLFSKGITKRQFQEALKGSTDEYSESTFMGIPISEIPDDF